MDKSQAVEDAVAAQLERDGRSSNQPDKKMGANFKYETGTMKIFLDAVKEILQSGGTSYTFTYAAAFVADALGSTVAALVGKIDARTEEVVEAHTLALQVQSAAVPKKGGATPKRAAKKKAKK